MVEHKDFLERYAGRHFADHMACLNREQRRRILAEMGAGALPPATLDEDPAALAPEPAGVSAVRFFPGAATVRVGLKLFLGTALLLSLGLAGYRLAGERERLAALKQNPPPVPLESLGDTRFLAVHAPWGAPAAELLIQRPAYLLGFHPQRKLCRWVSYKVRRGGGEGEVGYALDPLLPSRFQLSGSAYKRSDYERGTLITQSHLGNLSSRNRKTALYYSVVAPQARALNRSTLKKLENFSLQAAAAYEQVWLLAGPVLGDTLGWLDGAPIPSHYFYILVRGEFTESADVLAFLFPNSPQATENQLETYLVTVAHIESLTGLNFFPKLAQGRQGILEKHAAPYLWSLP